MDSNSVFRANTMSSFDQVLGGWISELTAATLRRTLRKITRSSGREVVVADQSLVNFASNDYLGLALHPAVTESATRAARQWGAGSAASRLLSGSLAIHHELEEALSAWKGTEASLLFTSGYATALGVIPALVGRGDVVILDKQVHACCVDAARLSGATIRVYRHNDLNHLESLLRWAREPSRDSSHVLVVTESVFSMDGDIAPLAEIVALKDQFGAWLLLDEAHATGLLGSQRSGLAEATRLTSWVDVHLGTLGKALGSVGGYVSGSRILIDLMVNQARSQIFSTAPAPTASAAALAALEITQSDEGRRRSEKVWENVEGLARALPQVRPPASAIVPVGVGTEARALAASELLQERGLWVPAIRYPTVARGKSRLRITVTASHTTEDMTRLSTSLRTLLAQVL